MKEFKNGLLYAVLGLTVIFAAPLAAQDLDLVSNLVSQLGVSEAQAAGGVQAILGATKGKLSPTDYASLLSGAPSLGKLAEGMGSDAASTAAESATAEVPATASEMPSMDSASAAMGSASEAMGSAGGALGGLDMSSLSQLTGLTSQFEELGLDAGMVQKFVPTLLQQFGKDSATSGLLMKGLGLL